MNIVELSKALDIGQTAYSYELKERIIMKHYGIFVFDGEDKPNETIVSCNMNYLCSSDWEIDLPFVDFWTAWQAARDEGWGILLEGAESPFDYGQTHYLTTEMVNGRWQILKG